MAREISVQAVDKALAENRMILLTAQRDKNLEDPEEKREYTWISVDPESKEAVLGWYQELARPNPG